MFAQIAHPDNIPAAVVRFSDSLALGSESGFQYPYRRVFFLSAPPAQKNVNQIWAMGCLLDSSTSQLSSCPITSFFTHWSRRQHSISFLPLIATFDRGKYFIWISHFQICPRQQFCISSAILVQTHGATNINWIVNTYNLKKITSHMAENCVQQNLGGTCVCVNVPPWTSTHCYRLC